MWGLIKMRIYIPKKEENFFIKKLNENTDIDDYLLEGHRVGKTKIILKWKKGSDSENPVNMWNWIVKTIPVEGVAINEDQIKNEDKILIIGKIKEWDFFKLQESVYKVSTIKKEKEQIHFNAWIPLANYHHLHHYSFLIEFQTIYEITEQPCRCKITMKYPVDYEIYQEIKNRTNGVLVHEKDVYLKSSLQDIHNIYHHFQKNIDNILFLHHLT